MCQLLDYEIGDSGRYGASHAPAEGHGYQYVRAGGDDRLQPVRVRRGGTERTGRGHQ